MELILHVNADPGGVNLEAKLTIRQYGIAGLTLATRGRNDMRWLAVKGSYRSEAQARTPDFKFGENRTF